MPSDSALPAAVYPSSAVVDASCAMEVAGPHGDPSPQGPTPPEAASLGRLAEHAWALKRAHALKEQLQRLAGVPGTESAAQACSAELAAILAEFPTLPQALAAPLQRPAGLPGGLASGKGSLGSALASRPPPHAGLTGPPPPCADPSTPLPGGASLTGTCSCCLRTALGGRPNPRACWVLGPTRPLRHLRVPLPRMSPCCPRTVLGRPLWPVPRARWVATPP